MLRTILWFTYFWIVMFFALFFLIPCLILFIFRQQKTLDRFVEFITTKWAQNMIWAAGGKVEVSGIENLPEHNRICFVSNHQGSFDIVLIIGYVPKMIGFIAKKELSTLPIVNFWMKALHCLFIDRKNARKAHKTIQQAIEYIQMGRPLLVFPEGTRSKRKEMNDFKKGSMKIPIRANAVVVPLTINGTYKLREEKGWISSGRIKLHIHPPIHISQLNDDEKNNLHHELQKIIASGLQRS